MYHGAVEWVAAPIITTLSTIGSPVKRETGPIFLVPTIAARRPNRTRLPS